MAGWDEEKPEGSRWKDERSHLLQSVDERLVQYLQAGGWKSPAVISNAIDTEVEAFELVCEVVGLRETDTLKLRWAAELWGWMSSAEQGIKRLKSSMASSTFEEMQASVLTRQMEAQKILHNSLVVSTVLDCCGKEHWRVRKNRAEVKPDTAEGRLDLEDRERRKWTQRVIEALVESKLPVVRQAELALNKEKALERAVGKRRSRTLRARMRMWFRIRMWLECVHRVVFPVHIGHMLDFLEDMARGEYGRSLPNSVAASLGFLEKVGGVKEEHRICIQPLFMSTVQSMTQSSQVGNTGTKKAPSMFISILVSLELLVVDKTRRKFRRALGWVLLIRHWTSMRSDDLQGLDRARMTLSAQCWRSILTRTKTTGPGMRTLEVPVFVHAKAGFTGNNWLAVGYSIWNEEGFAFERDYFLPRPNREWTAPIRKMADYSDCSGMTRSLLQDLEVPEKNSGGVWVHRTGSQLIKPPGHMFFQEHSARNFMPSVAAAIGIHKDDRDFLGRWGVNSGGSNDYVATSRQVVLRIQSEICKSICTGPNAYDEFDVINDYRTFLSLRMPGIALKPWLEDLSLMGAGETSLQQPWPMTELGEDELEVVITGADDQCHSAALLRAAGTQVGKPSDSPFWISVTRNGFKRLHRTKGCRVTPEECFRWEYLSEIDKSKGKVADKACKLCWPEAGQAPEEGSSAGSSGSSSSSTSSEEDEEIEFDPEDMVEANLAEANEPLH